MDPGRGDPRRHRHRHERPRRTVLARQDQSNQIRPRARPRYTLTPSMVFKGDMPMMAIGTPGGDNQDQTILQALLSMVEFWDDWYPNLHAAFERPRVQTLHFYGSFWPHAPGFNKLNVEATVPDAVYNELRARGHDVSRLRRVRHVRLRHGRDDRPGDGNRIAAGDPRRDCYAMAVLNVDVERGQGAVLALEPPKA